jgi:erythromycin esterase
MAENLAWIRNHWPAGTKIVTWAHNGHVSHGSDTNRSMGYFLDKMYDDEHIVFGFAFHRGEYVAKGERGIDVYSTSSSEPGSVEWLLRESDIPQFILDLRQAKQDAKGSRWLFQEMDFRSIGAWPMDYAFISLKVREMFDILVFFENTSPSHCFRMVQKK